MTTETDDSKRRTNTEPTYFEPVELTAEQQDLLDQARASLRRMAETLRPELPLLRLVALFVGEGLDELRVRAGDRVTQSYVGWLRDKIRMDIAKAESGGLN